MSRLKVFVLFLSGLSILGCDSENLAIPGDLRSGEYQLYLDGAESSIDLFNEQRDGLHGARQGSLDAVKAYGAETSPLPYLKATVRNEGDLLKVWVYFISLDRTTRPTYEFSPDEDGIARIYSKKDQVDWDRFTGCTFINNSYVEFEILPDGKTFDLRRVEKREYSSSFECLHYLTDLFKETYDGSIESVPELWHTLVMAEVLDPEQIPNTQIVTQTLLSHGEWTDVSPQVPGFGLDAPEVTE
ncbi:MAG: hypothetical protein CL678_06460 [Bdellovibrionaceae bacterium]|nr:hypothetical protein [Pseudobdellovibrionaceae bacterium]|tara:strand:+ start:553 stop:1281 length:729 start_codon:yes stop_codon:yes gene_type:complete